MQNELKIIGIQKDIVWENPEENRKQFSKIIAELDADVIVLPEMFTTGFTMNPKNVAETMDGKTIAWMAALSKSKNAAITGSLVLIEDNMYYNRLLFVHPSGKIETYDKKHLFTLAGEDEAYTAGKNHLIVDYKGWKICPFICYDLRFPVWARNTANYDVLLFVANWPIKRINAWNILLKARAIENMSYVIGVNRVGLDVNDFKYSGNSAIVNYLGTEISTLKPNQNGVVSAILNKSNQNETRHKLGFLNDKDSFKLL